MGGDLMAREWDVPGYTEVKTLGSGGFGDVVLARHDASGAAVAIKYLRPQLLADPEFAELFRAEAAVLASLDDPNVVRLYEYVESPSGAAIVMELIDGVSLRDILVRQGATTAEAALVVLQGSLLGLAAAHRRGVVHRDYKPENVLINGAGESKLTDFGIAARAGDSPIPAGTLVYAPPEQFGGSPATPASDVYAATATFYECLTGRPPFTGDTAERLLYQHMSQPVPLEPVPEPLRPLVAAGLAKDPGGRPSDGTALVAELRAVAGGAYGPDWEERGRSALAAAALLLAALWPAGGPAAAARQRRAPDPPAPAHQAPARQPGQGSHRGRRRGRGRGRGHRPGRRPLAPVQRARYRVVQHRGRTCRSGRHLRHQCLGRRLHWQFRQPQAADRAVERDQLEAGAQLRPPQRGAQRRGRHLRQQRLGGRPHDQRPEPDRALERQQLEASTERGRRRQPRRSGRHLRRQRLGRRLHRFPQSQAADPALERHQLEASTQPEPRRQRLLDAVAVTSGRNAWAVGMVSGGTSPAASLILHWTGTTWQRVPSPSPSDGKYGNALSGVAATSATSAWAVGCTDGCPLGGTPLIERWNGTSWKQVAAPATPYGLYNLLGVAATSATGAWAVGGGGPVTLEGTATTHWNGRDWTLSHARSGAILAGVTAISATNAWAVGETASGHTVILHWDGQMWSGTVEQLSPAAAPAPSAVSSSASAVASPALSPQRQAAQALAALLAQSGTDRVAVTQAVSAVAACSSGLSQDETIFSNAASSRQALLGQLAALVDRSALPAPMLQDLTTAWQASGQADQDFANWTQDEISQGCSTNYQSDASYQAATVPDGQATTYKKAFAALWTAIANEYGLPSYRYNQI